MAAKQNHIRILSWRLIYSLILARILVGLLVVVHGCWRKHRGKEINILVITEEGVLLLTDLDGVTTELNRDTLVYIFPCIREGLLGPHTWGMRTLSPALTPMGRRLPSRSRRPGPTART